MLRSGWKIMLESLARFEMEEELGIVVLEGLLRSRHSDFSECAVGTIEAASITGSIFDLRDSSFRSCLGN